MVSTLKKLRLVKKKIRLNHIKLPFLQAKKLKYWQFHMVPPNMMLVMMMINNAYSQATMKMPSETHELTREG